MLEQFAYQGHDPAQEEPVFRAVVRNEGPVDAPRARLEIWRRFDRDSRYASRERVVPSQGRAQFEVLVPQEWTQDGGMGLRWGVRARIVDGATGAACEVWPR